MRKQLAAIVAAFFSVSSAFAHGDVHRRIEEVTRLLEQDGDNAELYYKRGRLYLEHESWSRALADLEEARRLRPDLSELDYYRARACFGAGDAAAADGVLVVYLGRLGEHGALARGHFLHGQVLRALGRPLDAAGAFERAVAAAEHPLPDQYLAWARAFEAAGEAHLGDAVAVLDRGIGTLGPLVSLALPAVELEVARGAVPAAVERLDRMIATLPLPAAYLHRRGGILADAGCPEKARESFEKALAIIEAMPLHRRRTRVYSDLEAALRADLAKLPEKSDSCPPELR